MQQVVGIEIKDKVDSSIGRKLKQFAKDSLDASKGIEKLKESLNSISSSKMNSLSVAATKMRDAFTSLNVASSKMTRDFESLSKAQQNNLKSAASQAIAEQKLAQEIAKTSVAVSGETLAQQKLATERARTAAVVVASSNKTTIAEQQLAREIHNTSAAQAKAMQSATNLSSSQQKLAQETAKTTIAQQKIVTATNQTAISQNKLSESSFRLLTSQQQLALKQTQLLISSRQLATASVNTATAQQRLVTATNQSAASINTLSLSNIRLLTGQQQLATATNATTLSMQRLSTETARTGMAQARTNNEVARGATVATQTAIAEQRLANAQQQAAIGAVRHERAILALERAQQRAITSVRTLSYLVRDYLRVAMLVSAIVYPVSSVLKFADSYVNLNNKLQLVSTSQAHANELMDEAGKIALRTRSDITSTVTSFARFDRALQAQGKSQKDVLKMTETINKAFIVSGSTAMESASAMLQLSQAFNANRLMGDEFRAVSENMPIAIKYIAEVLNAPISQIQKLRSEGKITADVMFKAFSRMSNEVNKAFDKTIPTMGQAMNYFKSSMTIMMGEFERATGTLESISRSLIYFSNNLKEAVVVGAGLVTAFSIMLSGPLVAALKVATIWSLKFAASLLMNPLTLVAAGIASLGAAYLIFGDKVKMSEGSVASWSDFSKQAVDNAGSAWGNFFRSFADGANETDSLAWKMFANMGAAISDFVGSKITLLNEFYADVQMTPASIAMAIAKTMDAVIVFTMSAVDVIILAFKQVGEDIMDVATMVGRGLWSLVEMFTNAFIDFFNGFLMMLNMVATEITKIMPGVTTVQPGSLLLDNVSFESQKPSYIPRDERKGFDETSSEIYSKRFESIGTVMQDYVANTIKATEETAVLNAAQNDASKTTSQLRGETEKLNDASDTNAGRSAKQAQSLAKVVMQMDNEIARMRMITPLREEQERFDKVREKMVGKGLKLTESETKMLKEKIAILEQVKKMQSEMDRIYNDSVGPLEKYNATVEATNILLKEQIISQQQASAELSKARVAMANSIPTNEQLGMSALENMGVDISSSDMAIEARLQQMQLYYDEVERLRQDDLISEQAANHAKADLEMRMLQARSAQYKDFFDGLSQLQTSNIKALAHIGKAASITQAVINTYEGATKALAQGGIYGAAMAAVVVANGLAQVANIRSQQVGFKKGGYTGDIGRNTVAGEVHGNEFVFDADATSRLGPNNLEALRSGAISLGEKSDKMYNSTTVVNNNNYSKLEGESKQAKVSVINVLDPSLLSDYVNSPEGEQQIINVMYRNQQALQG